MEKIPENLLYKTFNFLNMNNLIKELNSKGKRIKYMISGSNILFNQIVEYLKKYKLFIVKKDRWILDYTKIQSFLDDKVFVNIEIPENIYDEIYIKNN